MYNDDGLMVVEVGGVGNMQTLAQSYIPLLSICLDNCNMQFSLPWILTPRAHAYNVNQQAPEKYMYISILYYAVCRSVFGSKGKRLIQVLTQHSNLLCHSSPSNLSSIHGCHAVLSEYHTILMTWLYTCSHKDLLKMYM